MLKTYPGLDVNNISNTLKKYLGDRKLKPTDIVKYRLLGGVKNVDPQRKKGEDILFPSVLNIPIAGYIVDPGDEQGDNVVNGGTKQVGAIRHFDDKTKMPVFKKYYVKPEKGDGGIFMIKGNVVDDLDIYESLELSNCNASNPYRDASVMPLFERVNEVSEAESRSKKRNYLFDSYSAIRNWTYDEMRIIAAGYNLNTLLPREVLKERLEEIAEKDAESFLKAIDSEDLKIKAVISLAQKADVIQFIAHESKWIFTGSEETITILDRKEGLTENDQFALFLKNSTNGDKIRGNIEKLIAAKKKK